MGKVIPLASTLAVKQEDLFGVMATLTGVTGNTAEVSTQLKATMQGFLSPSSNMQKSLQKLGYANGQALLESKGLQGALTALQESVGGDQLAFAKLFSSVEAQTAVLALAGEQADNFASKTAQMYDASGAAATAFATATDNAESKMQRAKTAVTNLGLVLGNTFLPYVTTAADKLAGVVQKVEVNAGMGCGGQADCRFAQGLKSALYSKKSPSFTAFFSFTASQTGRPVKNSSGSPVAMLAMTQAYRSNT